MAASPVPVLARRRDELVMFRVVGRGTADYCPAMRQFAESAVASGATAIQVDLRDCVHFDSTFLGTLLLLRRSCPDSFALTAPSAPCRKIFDELGAATFFRVCDGIPAEEGDWEEMPGALGAGTRRPFQENVVASHRELARMPGPVGERYRPIAEQIAAELEGDGDKPPP